jgi:hypothetical protein
LTPDCEQKVTVELNGLPLPQLSSLPSTHTSAKQSPQNTLIFVSGCVEPALHVVRVMVPPVPVSEYHRLAYGPSKTPHGMVMSSVAPVVSKTIDVGRAPRAIAPSHSSLVGAAGQGHSTDTVISPVSNELKDEAWM